MMSTLRSDSTSVVVSVGVETDAGKERSENQDRVTRAATPYGDLFVVADGVGGYKGGGEAAQATVDGFAAYLNAHPGLPLEEVLQQAVRAINGDLQQRSAANLDLQGMGSTVVLCVVHGDRATYAHAGDSRVYRLRGGHLQQQTRDHSVMEQMIATGVLTPEQAENHPNASVITRALGTSSDVSLDIAEIELEPGDALLLCSDGLWAYAPHAEMEVIANSAGLSPSAVASALLHLALEGGGGDNISLQFLRFDPKHASTAASSSGFLGGRPGMLAVIALVLLLGSATLGLFLWNQRHSPASMQAPSAAAPLIARPAPKAAHVASPPPPVASPPPPGAKPAAQKPSRRQTATGAARNKLDQTKDNLKQLGKEVDKQLPDPLNQ